MPSELWGPGQVAAPSRMPCAQLSGEYKRPRAVYLVGLLGGSDETAEGTESTWRSESDARGVCRASPWDSQLPSQKGTLKGRKVEAPAMGARSELSPCTVASRQPGFCQHGKFSSLPPFLP